VYSLQFQTPRRQMPPEDLHHHCLREIGLQETLVPSPQLARNYEMEVRVIRFLISGPNGSTYPFGRIIMR